MIFEKEGWGNIPFIQEISESVDYLVRFVSICRWDLPVYLYDQFRSKYSDKGNIRFTQFLIDQSLHPG